VDRSGIEAHRSGNMAKRGNERGCGAPIRTAKKSQGHQGRFLGNPPEKEREAESEKIHACIGFLLSLKEVWEN
jgi:hypothetical protein